MKDKTFVRDVADRFECDDRRAEILIFAAFQESRNCAIGSRLVKLATLPHSYQLR